MIIKKEWLLFVLLFLPACKNSKNIDTKRKESKILTTLQWKDSIIDLGRVSEGEKIPFLIVVKNTGNNPLMFSEFESTCGCTVINTESLAPVQPGASDTIAGYLNTTDLSNKVIRKIYALANTQQQFYILTIKARVGK